MSKKTTAIYNALSANGDFKGSEQDFNKKFFAPGKAGYEYRKGVYDTLHKGGADVGSSYEEFGQLIGLRAVPRQQQQVQQPQQPQAIQKPKPTTSTPMSDAEKRAMIGTTADMVAQTGQQIAQTGRAIEHAKRHTGLDVRTPKLGQNRNVDKVQDPVSGKAQYETEDGQVYDNEAYATQAQNEYDQAKQHAGESELNRELREAKQQQADLEEALRKRREELDNGGKGFFGKMLESAAQATRPDVAMHHNNVADYEQDEEYGQLMAAIRQNRGAIQVLEDKKNNKMNSFWHSFATTAANGYTFGDGRAELNDAIALTNAQKRLAQINAKRERGEMLTREEESAEQVLTAALRNQAMQGKYGDEYGGWAIAGAGAPVSLDMMKNMLLGGGMFQDVSKGVAKGIAKAGLKQVAKASTKGLLKGVSRTAAKGLVKATGVTLGSLASGALVSNTTGLTKTLGEAAKGATGNVGLDKHGHFQFENQKGLMSALAEAERSQIGENASEMFGEFIPEIGIGKLAIRGLEKIGLSKMAGFLTSMGGKQWAKQYAQVLRASGFNGMPNEALEEYAGILYNQLTGDSDNGLKTLADVRTHRDIWLGTATVGALMGAPNVVMAGAGAAQYYRYKHAMERAAKNASYRLTEDKWKPLQEAIDSTPNEGLTDLMMDIYGRKDMEMPEKKAVYDYIHNLVKYRGYNVGTINFNDSRKQENDPKQNADMAIEGAADAAYTDGYNAQGVDMARAKREYDTATKRLIEVLGSDAVDALSQEPVLALKKLHNDGALEDDATRDAATAFVNAKMKFDGVVQRAKDDLDGMITDAHNSISQRTHQDGAIHPVTLKEDDKRAYVVDGNIAMLDDGTTIDTQNSDDTIIIRGEDGKLEFTSPSAIMSVGDLIDPAEERKMAEQTITQDFGTRRAAEIDGIDENGQPIPLGDEEVQAQAQAQAQEQQSETTPTEQQEQQKEVAEEQQQDGAQPMPMVKNKDGEEEPDFMATTPQRAHQYIYDEAELPREVADEFVTNNAKAAQAHLDKVKKKQPKMGTSIAKYKAEQAAHQEQLNAAEAAVKYWAEVKATQDAIDRQKREEMLAKQAEATAKAEEEEKERQAQETAKRKEQEERGAGNPHAKVREKWDNAPKVMGVEDELTLPNGEKVKGHYVLVESGAATPSHDATREFAKSEGFPVDENGQSVNDRDYERDQDAQEVTRNIAANYDGRALQNPVVVSTDGVVLSGNGRTMAGELAARDDTDGAYVSHLAKYPQKYGFTEEQVQGMRHPRVVFMADEAMPYTAETFAKFNQQEMKGQSKTEQSVKMGKVVPNDVFNRIIKGINGYDTLAEFYADTTAARDAILELQGAGVITQAQMAEMFDGDGISAQGRELLENMLIGKAFEGNPDAVRQLAEYKGMRQSVITALAEIANNKAMGEDYDLGAEIAAAISLAYQARKAGFKAGEKVSSYARQMNLFTFDDGETVADYTNATMLMLADVLNDNRTTALKRILAVYNHRAADQANGQLDLFAGGIKNKEDIINEVKQLIYDGTEQEQQAAIDRAVESRKESVQQDGTDERGDEGSEPERGGEVDETSRAARGVDGTLEESGARDNGGNAGEQATEPTAKGVEKPTQGNVANNESKTEADYIKEELKELEDFISSTDSNKRTALNEDEYDAKDLYAPLLLDGKKSNLAVTIDLPSRITDPSYPIALYDFEHSVNDFDWERMESAVEEYNSHAKKEDKASMWGDTGSLSFRSVDAAVKFNDWMLAKESKVEKHNDKQEDLMSKAERIVKEIAEQGKIEPVPIKDKRPIPVIKFAEKDKKKNEVRPALSGVYHDGGYVVATDGFVLLARKEDYDKSLEGKVTDQKGNMVATAYPKWQKLVSPANGYSAGVEINGLHSFVRGVFVKLKSKKANKRNRSTIGIAFKDANGEIRLYNANNLDKFLSGMESIGAKDIIVDASLGGLYATSAHGYVVVMPTPIQNLDAGIFVYEPTSEEGKEHQKADLVTGEEVEHSEKDNLDKKTAEEIKMAEDETDTNPTEAQKESGNYRKGHVRIDGMEISIEQPKGSVRRGTDAKGNKWESKMHNTYGYIRGTQSVDGDHIDVFLSDAPLHGMVYVVDQVDPETGEFDEHKVMYGFESEDAARKAYLSNYEKGWKGLGAITEVSREDFKEWVQSSKRKTKPFAEYKSVKASKETKGGDTSAANAVLSQKDYVQKRLSEDLANTPYKTLEEWETADIEGYSEQYDNMIAEYPSYLRELAKSEKLQEIYDRSSVKEQKKIREHLEDADIDYKEVLNTSPQRTRVQDRITEEIKYAKGVFSDGTTVSGKVVGQTSESVPIEQNGRKYTIKAKDILEQSDEPISVDKAEFQVGRDNLSSTTDEQELATNAVLSLLENAGIPVEVVSEETAVEMIGEDAEMKTPQGTIYGWTIGGKVYLTQDGLNPETPIHEYTHIWAEAMRRKNADGWDSVKALLKDTPVWNEVLNDPNYQDIKDDEDSVASEVLSRISGKENAKRFEEQAKKTLAETRGIEEKAQVANLISNVRRALNKFWNWVGKDLFGIKKFSSIEEVTDRVLYDLVNGTDLGEVKNDEVRFHKGKSEDDTKTLMGVHNITEDKFLKAIKMGGFANPSAAIIDTSKNIHDDYGEISLIMPSSMIDKRTGRNAGTFEGDAWTPMYPTVERQASMVGLKVINDDIKSVPKEMQNSVSNAIIAWEDGDVLLGLEYLYLFQKGKAPRVLTEQRFDADVHKSLDNIMARKDSAYDLTKDEVKELVNLYVQVNYAGNINKFEKKNENQRKKDKATLERAKPNSIRYKMAKENLEDIERYGYVMSSLNRFVNDVQRDKMTQGVVDVNATLNSANDVIKKEKLEDDFNEWLESLDNRYQIKEVIFDGFTPSGNRRYVPNTLENVSKLMKKQGRQSSVGMSTSFHNFAASVMKFNNTLANIKKKKGKLASNYQDIRDFENKWKDVYLELGKKLQPDAGAFDDYGLARLQGAATQKDPQAYLKAEYGITLSDEDTQKLRDLIKAIQEERPAMYFETKFERPVMLEEFAAAVIPSNLDKKARVALQDAGLAIYEYEPGNVEDRKRAVDEAKQENGVLFRQKDNLDEDLKLEDVLVPTSSVRMPRKPRHNIKAYLNGKPVNRDNMLSVAQQLTKGEPFSLDNNTMLREIKSTVDFSDYYDGTIAEFKALPSDGKTVYEQWEELKAKGYEWHKSPLSNSEYLIDKETGDIYRYANHWGSVASCTWELVGAYDDYNYHIAVSNISDFKAKGYGSIAYPNVSYLQALNQSIVNVKDVLNDPTIDIKPKAREFLENILRDREMRRSDLLSDNDSLIDNRNVRKKRAAEPKPREEENQVEHSRETYTENKVREMETAVTDAAAKMNLGNVVVLPFADGLDGQKKRAKGWFDRRTGKITVVLGNHTSVEDAIKTLMHEAVAHYGLRKLFGKDFDTFLDNVYRNAPPSIRRKIVQLVLRNGWDVRVATEEYLASLAEDTDFEQAKESGWFQRVKELFVGMLRRLTERHKLFDISEDELRYVLWRSYENLTGNGGIMGEAQDVVKREKLLGGTRTAGEPNILFRQIDQDKINFDKAIARGKYEHRMREAGFQTVEAMQDSMKSLMELYKAVDEAENVKREVEDIPDSENAYVGENRLSSVNQAELDDYNRRFFKPLLNSIGALARTDEERQDLFDYMMAKHGLERNNVMATREAQKEYEELNQAAADGKGTAPDWDAILSKHRKRDYSGLTTLMRGDEDEIDTATAEQRAKELVERCEEEKGKADIDNLWYDVNAANAEVLWKMYRGGLLSKEAYHEIADMYKYYIPLRGFDEKTSGEEYAYLMGKNSAFTAPMKTAKGRTSKADNPIAQMALMADSAIMQANRNRLVKIPFLNYVTKHPSDLVSVSDMWLEYDEVNDTWKPKFPEISPEDTPEEVERKVDEFEEKMNELSTQQPDKYVRQGEKGNIPYRVLGSDMREHQVIVKRNGKDYVLTINGNPRAAQAINGLTNPDNKSTGAIDRVFDWIAQGNRWLSAAYTTRNPDFVVSNFIRDTFYSNVMVHVKEGRNYATKFHINHAICNPVMIGRLLHKYNNGELDMNNELQRYFYEFMMNGGETGWTSVKNAEQHKSDIKKTLDRGAAGKSVKKIFEGLDHLNRAIENSARFAAFVTSRQMGRQLGRSIYDAKEISVNFNKKGSGSKMLGATGQTWQGNTAAFVSGIGRGLYTFWNASVQGLTNYMRYTHRNPVKGYSLATALFGLGLLIPYVGYLMSGGDDDGNGYYDMPEYVRRSNILIKAGNGWAKIALPQEYRAIYGMGELAMTAMSGQNQMTRGEALLSAAEQLSQVLPIDFMEGGGSWTAAVPTALKPIVEASINRSWTGLPIYRDNPFNKDDPEWAKSYKSVNGELKAVTKWLSDNTGGDDYTGGAIDLNPAQIEYVMKGMLGGYYSFMDKVVKTAKMPFGAQPVEAKDIPFVNRLYVTGDERTKERAINNAYFKFSKEHDHTKKLLRNYEREAKQGSEKYIEKINLMYNEPEYARYLIFEEYSKEINHLGKLRKEVQGDPDATLEIDKQISDLRKEVVNKLREVK